MQDPPKFLIQRHFSTCFGSSLAVPEGIIIAHPGRTPDAIRTPNAPRRTGPRGHKKRYKGSQEPAVKHVMLTTEWLANWTPKRRQEVGDQGCRGLVARCGPSGVRTFYRF